MDEGRKRVIGIMAAILASLHMQTSDDLFGTPQGSPRTDKLIDASIQCRAYHEENLLCAGRRNDRRLKRSKNETALHKSDLSRRNLEAFQMALDQEAIIKQIDDILDKSNLRGRFDDFSDLPKQTVSEAINLLYSAIDRLAPIGSV